jgi:hypothetical protein
MGHARSRLMRPLPEIALDRMLRCLTSAGAVRQRHHRAMAASTMTMAPGASLEIPGEGRAGIGGWSRVRPGGICYGYAPACWTHDPPIMRHEPSARTDDGEVTGGAGSPHLGLDNRADEAQPLHPPPATSATSGMQPVQPRGQDDPPKPRRCRRARARQAPASTPPVRRCPRRISPMRRGRYRKWPMGWGGSAHTPAESAFRIRLGGPGLVPVLRSVNLWWAL